MPRSGNAPTAVSATAGISMAATGTAPRGDSPCSEAGTAAQRRQTDARRPLPKENVSGGGGKPPIGVTLYWYKAAR